MSKDPHPNIVTECDVEAMDYFYCLKEAAVKAVSKFYSNLNEFQQQNYKFSKELFLAVTAYNILNSGPPCTYPLIEKEAMLQELLTKIQEKTVSVRNSILSITKNLAKLHEHQKLLEKQSKTLNWNISTNPAIKKGRIRNSPPTQILEQFGDVIFQYETSITSMEQYYEALNLKQPKSYENLMNSFKTSKETVAFTNEFLVNNTNELL